MSGSIAARRFFCVVLWVWVYCNESNISTDPVFFGHLTDLMARTAACCIVRTVMNWQNAHADGTCMPLSSQCVGHDCSNIFQGLVSTTSSGERKSTSSSDSFHLLQASQCPSQCPFQPNDSQCRSQHRHHRRLPTDLAASLPPCPRQNHINNRPFLHR